MWRQYSVNNKKWTFHVKRTIDKLGLSDLWFEQNLKVALFSLFQQRIKDQFIQQWKSEIENASILKYYNKYKTEFCIGQYLLNIKNDKLGTLLTQFRLSAHKLAIEAGRFQNIDREQRPFVINIKINKNCPKCIELRKLFIINYTSFPTFTRFNIIMSSKNANSQLNLAKFIDKAMNVRKTLIYQINVNYDIVIC